MGLPKLSEERKQEILRALEEHGVELPCPRCGNSSFTLLDGYFNQPIQHDFKGMVLGGLSVPSVVVACKRCGYLSQHAAGILGLFIEKEAKNE